MTSPQSQSSPNNDATAVRCPVCRVSLSVERDGSRLRGRAAAKRDYDFRLFVVGVTIRFLLTCFGPMTQLKSH